MGLYALRPCAFCGTILSPRTSREKHCGPICRFLSIYHALPILRGCRLWQFGIDADGYGKFQIGTTDVPFMENAHRVAFVIFNGGIRDGYEVDHTCRVRHCVEFLHLQEVTPLQNKRLIRVRARR